jgi:CDP-paratose 2-epimerase
MSVAIVTGASGLVGSESVRTLDALGLDVLGIDNDMRRYFFGTEASTQPVADQLRVTCRRFRPDTTDIRDHVAVDRLFGRYGRAISLVIHTAAQPSHDWAAQEPLTDFSINATGTLHVLEATRRHCPEAVFIFTSTNKVYGDTPNRLPLREEETRWELPPDHPFFAHGIDESMSIDHSKHSLFGTSKLAADLLVQEYGRYFGMRTGIFRSGCVSGARHAGAEQHGFLAYLMKCAVTGRTYRVCGYKGKQVRDNIHSADLVDAFMHFFRAPRSAEVYNIGGGRDSHCSLMEAAALCEKLAGRPLARTYLDTPRSGDHIWWISNTRRFRSHYPGWRVTRDVSYILNELVEQNRSRWLDDERAAAG